MYNIIHSNLNKFDINILNIICNKFNIECNILDYKTEKNKIVDINKKNTIAIVSETKNKNEYQKFLDNIDMNIVKIVPPKIFMKDKNMIKDVLTKIQNTFKINVKTLYNKDIDNILKNSIEMYVIDGKINIKNKDINDKTLTYEELINLYIIKNIFNFNRIDIL